MGESIAKAINAAANAVQQVKEVRDDLTSRRGKLGAQLAELSARNAYLLALPVNREDGKRFTLECIDILARQFVSRTRFPQFIAMTFAYPQAGFSGQMGQKSSRPLALSDVVNVRENGWSQLGAGAKNFFGGMIDWNNQVEADALCFYFGDQMKKKLETHLGDWYPDYAERKDGRPQVKFHDHYKNATMEELASSIDARLSEIRENQSRIEKLEQECCELDEALAAVGSPAP